MRKYSKHLIKRVVIVLIVIITLVLIVLIDKKPKTTWVEQKIIDAINQNNSGNIGECEIDLSDVFTDFQWDTVSLFSAGNSKQVEDAVGIYPDVSNGIVFSLDGVHQLIDLTTYSFPNDEPPIVSYYIERTDLTSLFYSTLSRDNAVVHGEKYKWNEKYKYSVWIYT